MENAPNKEIKELKRRGRFTRKTGNKKVKIQAR